MTAAKMVMTDCPTCDGSGRHPAPCHRKADPGHCLCWGNRGEPCCRCGYDDATGECDQEAKP